MLQRRSTRTRLAVLAVCGSLSLAVTACGDDGGTSGSSGSGDVAAVIKGLDNPFFQLVLNPGHLIHIDEWMNTPVYPGSTEAFV